MNVALMMVSYRKDHDFAVYAMKSAKKFATGFSQMLCVVPNPDVELFRETAGPLGWDVIGFDETPSKGMLHHMGIICEADQWLPKADAILFMDSDCMFTAPVSPKDYIKDGKFVLYREKFENFKAYSTRYGWKACVKNAIGIDPEWETMIRHPMVHPPCVLQKTRELISVHTGLPFLQYILSGPNTFPQKFAEFPTIGAVAIAYFPELYHFVEWNNGLSDHVYENEKIRQFWSHGGLDMINDRHPGRKARDVMEEILASPI